MKRYDAKMTHAGVSFTEAPNGKWVHYREAEAEILNEMARVRDEERAHYEAMSEASKRFYTLPVVVLQCVFISFGFGLVLGFALLRLCR